MQENVIARKIITLRGEKVLLDIHLADLYEVETRALKQAVRRNKHRFPSDFLFELTEEEVIAVVSQNVIPSKKYLGGAIPFAFTENGVAMLAGILSSKKAIEVNIAIMRTFTLLRKMLLVQKDVIQEIEKIKRKIEDQDGDIQLIFEYLKQLELAKQEERTYQKRNRIGFRRMMNNIYLYYCLLRNYSLPIWDRYEVHSYNIFFQELHGVSLSL